MKIYYRISDTGYNKIKPDYINNENCLKNFIYIFGNIDIQIIADNCSENSLKMIYKYVHPNKVKKVSIGHGAGTFNLALDRALKLDDDDEIVYFVENDYLHKLEANNVLIEGIKLGSDYVSLYDHPDKYQDGINPYVEYGGEITKVFLSKSCHWKLTNSTTMTFATKVKILKEDEEILRYFTTDTHPNDFNMFLALREKGRSLITPLPGYSTHGETAWLSPLINWKKEIIC
jgi:hypothetical protein